MTADRIQKQYSVIYLIINELCSKNTAQNIFEFLRSDFDLVSDFLVGLSEGGGHFQLLDPEAGPHDVVLEAYDLRGHEGSTVGVDHGRATQARGHRER